MIKQKLQVSKARTSIRNTRSNQTAEAILHSFSQSFKTLPPLSLKLLFFFPFTAPHSSEISLKGILVWHHFCEEHPGICVAKCWGISSDPGQAKRILQSKEVEVKYPGPPLFSESLYQLLQYGHSAQILALSQHLLLLCCSPSKKL